MTSMQATEANISTTDIQKGPRTRLPAATTIASILPAGRSSSTQLDRDEHHVPTAPEPTTATALATGEAAQSPSLNRKLNFDAYVAAIVAQAPSFTDEQRRKLSVLLTPEPALIRAS
jgi:hypothetical protein